VDLPKFIIDAGIPPPEIDGLARQLPPFGQRLGDPSPILSPVDSRRRGMIALAIAAGIFNGLSFPLMRALADARSDRTGMLFVAPIVIGILLGEMGAMASWLVWGEGSFLRRLAAHWSVGLALVLALLGGAAAAMANDWNSFFVIYEALSLVCILPIISLAAQLPLWPLRTHFGWRVAATEQGSAADKSQPLSILDILSGTSVVAFSLGLVRAMPAAANVWQELAMAVLFVIGTSLILLLPGVLCILRMKQAGQGLVVYFGLTLVAAIGVISVLAALTSRLPSGEEVFAQLWGCCAFAATLAMPLFVLRACGYRLTWPRDRRFT
jgi:hypothetical protein